MDHSQHICVLVLVNQGFPLNKANKDQRYFVRSTQLSYAYQIKTSFLSKCQDKSWTLFKLPGSNFMISLNAVSMGSYFTISINGKSIVLPLWQHRLKIAMTSVLEKHHVSFLGTRPRDQGSGIEWNPSPTSPMVQIWVFILICREWLPTSDKSGAWRKNRNAPDSPVLLSTIQDNRGYPQFEVSLVGKIWDSRSEAVIKIPDRLQFSRRMKTRLKCFPGYFGVVNTRPLRHSLY